MDDSTIKAEIARLWDELNYHSKRFDSIEKDIKELNRIAISVEKLAVQMEVMTKEIGKLSKDVDEIKNRPAQAWTTMTRTAFTTIVSAIAGGLAVAVIQMISKAM